MARDFDHAVVAKADAPLRPVLLDEPGTTVGFETRLAEPDDIASSMLDDVVVL